MRSHSLPHRSRIPGPNHAAESLTANIAGTTERNIRAGIALARSRDVAKAIFDALLMCPGIEFADASLRTGVIEDVGDGIGKTLDEFTLAVVVVSFSEISSVGLVDPEVFDALVKVVALEQTPHVFARFGVGGVVVANVGAVETVGDARTGSGRREKAFDLHRFVVFAGVFDTGPERCHDLGSRKLFDLLGHVANVWPQVLLEGKVALIGPAEVVNHQHRHGNIVVVEVLRQLYEFGLILVPKLAV